MDDEEARGEAPLHTSQSSEARLGRLTGAVALEQLSFLSFGRIGAGAREPRLDEDFVPQSSGLAPRRCRRSWYPPFAKNAKDGAPTVLTASAKSKPGPPAELNAVIRETKDRAASIKPSSSPPNSGIRNIT